MSSIKDVAKKAGVSISTVSNVLNGTKYVSSELRRKVEIAVKELQYEVDPIAKSMKSSDTKLIGVITTDITRPIYSYVIDGLQTAATQAGYTIMMYNTNNNFDNEQKFIKILLSNRVSGIILHSSTMLSDADYFNNLAHLTYKKRRVPVVSMELDLTSYGLDSIFPENYKGAKLATYHLLQMGCKRIAHLSGPANSPPGYNRMRGYKDALLNSDYEVDEQLIIKGTFSQLCGYNNTKSLIERKIPFDGIFAANDQMAVGACRACKESGLKIPQDVKVVGFDNTFVASIVKPSITTINIPKYELGYESVNCLLKQIENENPILAPIRTTLETELIVRESTDQNAPSDWVLYDW